MIRPLFIYPRSRLTSSYSYVPVTESFRKTGLITSLTAPLPDHEVPLAGKRVIFHSCVTSRGLSKDFSPSNMQVKQANTNNWRNCEYLRENILHLPSVR